jgi:hypothetical protein
MSGHFTKELTSKLDEWSKALTARLVSCIANGDKSMDELLANVITQFPELIAREGLYLVCDVTARDKVYFREEDEAE